MAVGATLVSPETVFLAFDTVLGRDVTIEPFVVFGPGVRIEDGVRIGAFSRLERCRVRRGAIVGPYARLRPGADVGPGAHVGNFVEVKNAALGAGAKVNHLAYVGDAAVGAGANLGAGTITCNYDGVSKHRTEIGDGAFIGSNSALVAPLRIGAGAYVASGSVVTEDVPEGALAIGRARQATKPGLGARLRARLAALAGREGN
jgi:bifunctional UDP-N-acetylglucosamine pyrophosphorylase/glucosamine-1-phosphate N-acetyltransferase